MCYDVLDLGAKNFFFFFAINKMSTEEKIETMKVIKTETTAKSSVI